MDLTASPSDLNTRARLMRAGAKVFADHGLRGATVRAIAAEAGVANQMITYHFGSKERLWREVVDWLFQSVAEVSAQVRWEFDTGGDDAQFLRHLRNMLEYKTEKVLLRRIMIREGGDDSDSKRYVYRLLEKTIGNNRRFFDDVHKAGVARRVSPTEMHGVFVSITSWWHVQPEEVKMTFGIDPTETGSAEAMARHLFTIFTGRMS